MSITEHTASYAYDRHMPKVWRVTCTCGWWYIGTRDDCETRFSSHDLGDWIEETPKPEWQRRLDEIKLR